MNLTIKNENLVPAVKNWKFGFIIVLLKNEIENQKKI